MYIFDKTITKYTKETMSVCGCHPWWYRQDLIVTVSGKIIQFPRLRRYHHQSCQRYNNYYTVFYIQQVINKLKVISAVCVVKNMCRL